MTELPRTIRVRRRFQATSERVFDAWLDPAKAGRFLFATPTGQMVRAEIDPRPGGSFCFVDRRGDEDVEHTGTYLEIDRPHRLVFSFSVPRYSSESTRVTIEIVPLGAGCELCLTHEGVLPNFADRTEEGWGDILETASRLVIDASATCGLGVALHATLPARIAEMFDGLAETLELHRRMLPHDNPAARAEDDVYRELATGWADIARSVASMADRMAAQSDLPMAPHDETAWCEDHVRAFEKLVGAQRRVLALVQIEAEQGEQTLASLRES